MGLDLSVAGTTAPDSLSCSYTGFHHFRTLVARLHGIDYESDLQCINAGDLSSLLCHSDCDGSMDHRACRTTAKVLTAMIDDKHPEMDEDDQDYCRKLIALMTYAGKKRRRLIFS